jgi:hypothetical protein
MVQVFPFQKNTGLVMVGKAMGLIQRGGPSRKIPQQHPEFLPELFRVNDFQVIFLQLPDIGIKHFRDIGSPVFSVKTSLTDVIFHAILFF